MVQNICDTFQIQLLIWMGILIILDDTTCIIIINRFQKVIELLQETYFFMAPPHHNLKSREHLYCFFYVYERHHFISFL